MRVISKDDGISWQQLNEIVGPSEIPEAIDRKKSARARQGFILTSWDDAAKEEKAKGKVKKPKPQQPLIRPARVAVKPSKRKEREFIPYPAEPTPSETQPSLWVGHD